MSIGKIGQAHKITYASRNFTSGLTDIAIGVLKPDGSLHSSGTMTEISQAGFEGIYTFNISTNSVDPTGEYVVSIVSPTEGHKAKTKVSFVNLAEGGSSVNDISGIEIMLDVTKPSISLNTQVRKIGLGLKKAFAGLSITANTAALNINKVSEELEVTKPYIEIEMECNK